MLPNNTIRYPAPLIDFAGEVGLTGQDHDTYPAPDTQPRYDWLRITLQGLLSSQSSFVEPTEYRDGTLWFDLNNITLKIYDSNIGWVPLSNVIAVEDGTGTSTTTTLAEWYAAVQSNLLATAPEATFSGYCTADGITTIIVPIAFQSQIDIDKSRPILYINGLLVDPRDVEFFSVSTISLKNGIVLDTNDKFKVMIKNITLTLFHVPNVIVP